MSTFQTIAGLRPHTLTQANSTNSSSSAKQGTQQSFAELVAKAQTAASPESIYGGSGLTPMPSETIFGGSGMTPMPSQTRYGGTGLTPMPSESK